MAEEATQDKNEEEKDSELDMLAEQELIRLTRQFRVKFRYSEKAKKIWPIFHL